MIQLDIILPLYKPKKGWESHILEAVGELRRYLTGKGCELHLFIVNDGSEPTYFSEENLAKIRNAAGKFTFLSYADNHGKGYSLRYAVSRTDGDYQIYTDGDFPFSWHSVADAYNALQEGADVVMGCRSKDYSAALPTMRKHLSRGVKRLNRFLLELPEEYSDTQSGLKGFNRLGKKIFLSTTVDSFLFDTEFILIAWKNSLNISCIPLQLKPNLHFSKMGTKVMLRELRHFVKVIFKHRFKRRQPRLE
ncbi:MAG: glycosyltransferase family 2 protein [Victivallaceae bacterium]